MELTHTVLFFLHLIGFAIIFGGLLSQVNTTHRIVTRGMFHGLWLQLGTGVGLVVTHPFDINHIKISIKLGLLIILCILFYSYRSEILTKRQYLTVLFVVITTVVVAVFW